MSYYFNSKKTNTIYSDSDKIPNAKKIKQAFVYKTNLNPNDTNGTCYSYENFFIKDGSLPYFNPSYGEDADKNLITAFSAGYMPIMEVVLSSISGKYNLTTDYGLYVQSFNITPILYKIDMFKKGYEQVISDLNFSSAGKLTWRMSEENLKYFTYTNKGPTHQDCDDTTSAHNLSLGFLDDTFENSKSFIYGEKDNSYTMIGTNIGRFIKSKPNDVYSAKDTLFGLQLHDTFEGTNTPPHFTMNISSIRRNAPHQKLKLKMEGLYLYANASFGQLAQTTTAIDTSYIKNEYSFSADTNKQNTTYPYCHALFYAINDSDKLEINDVNYTRDYIGNGVYYSNLKPAENFVSDKPVVSNKNDYTVKYMAFNDTYSKEIQSLDNKKLWDNMGTHYIADNKMYDGADEIIDHCLKLDTDGSAYGYCYEYCPICHNMRSTLYTDDETSARYLKCCEETVGIRKGNIGDYSDNYIIEKCTKIALQGNVAKHTSADTNHSLITENHDANIWGVKVPIYTAMNDTTPKGYWVAANCVTARQTFNYITYWRGACCNGTKSAPKMSGTNDDDFWKLHDVDGDGWKAGELEYIPFICKNNMWYEKTPRAWYDYSTRKDVFTSCPLCNSNGSFLCYCVCDNDNKDTIDQQGVGHKGTIDRVKHKGCFEKNNDGTLNTTAYGGGWCKPYKTNYNKFYRLKFYGLNTNTKAFNGFAPESTVSGLSANTGTDGRYCSTAWDYNNEKTIWTETDHPDIEEGKSGVFAYRETTSSDYTDYRQLVYGQSFRPSAHRSLGEAISAEALEQTTAHWMLMAHTANRGIARYWGLRGFNAIPQRLGVLAGTGTTFDVMWKKEDTDPFGNIPPAITQEFNSAGMTPSAGPNYTYATVTLTSEIDLSNENRPYLHICYPYTTVMNKYDTGGIISQMSISYELV